jgi:hypothetical protein
MTEPDTPPTHPIEGDATLSNAASSGDAAFDAVLRGLSAVAPPSASVREAHLAVALSHVSAGDATPSVSAPASDATVISLDSRRRTRFVAMTSVAAAAVFAVGLGVGASFGGSDTTIEAASAASTNTPPVKNAAPSAAPTTAQRSASTTSDPSPATNLTAETVMAASVDTSPAVVCPMGQADEAISTISAGINVSVQRAVVDGKNILYVVNATTCEVLFQFDLGG